MITWKNLDQMNSFQEMKRSNHRVNLKDELSGQQGAKRVSEYKAGMAEGLSYCYAAKQVDEEIISQLQALSDGRKNMQPYITVPLSIQVKSGLFFIS